MLRSGVWRPVWSRDHIFGLGLDLGLGLGLGLVKYWSHVRWS